MLSYVEFSSSIKREIKKQKMHLRFFFLNLSPLHTNQILTKSKRSSAEETGYLAFRRNFILNALDKTPKRTKKSAKVSI